MIVNHIQYNPNISYINAQTRKNTPQRQVLSSNPTLAETVQNISFGGKRFAKALTEGNLKKIQRILHFPFTNKSKLLNRTRYSETNETALMKAISDGNIELAKLLLSQPDIDVNLQDRDGNSALLRACVYGHSEIVKKLLTFDNINVNIENWYGSTPLLVAICQGYTDIAMDLLRHNRIDINLYTCSTALIKACAYKNEEVVRELLSREDIDVNADSEHGCALYEACGAGDLNIVKQLLNHPDIDINICDMFNVTPIMRAMEKGKIEVVEELLKRPEIDLTIKKYNNWDLLSFAKHNYYINTPQELIDKIKRMTEQQLGTIIEETNDIKNPPESPAEPQGFPFDVELLGHKLTSNDILAKNDALNDIIKYIESEKFNPELTDELGRNIIQIALASRDERVKSIILKAIAKGTNINAQNCFGQTPLMTAIKNFITADDDNEKFIDLSVIKFILDQNPDIDIQDKNKQTAFHLVCMSTVPVLLTLLLSKNPNILFEDVKGKRGADYFKTNEMKETFKKYLNLG